MFGFQLMLFVPTLFSLAYKAQTIDPADKESSLGFVLGFGAIFGLAAGPVPGVLSDGMRLAWGRRRPYIVIGFVLSAVGGLRADRTARVQRVDGAVVPGLYATGNTMASVAGPYYPGPGIPIGSAMVFGYLAARAMTR
ncbi:FAD-binding protein [Streptomyces mirabilis]|uniref:FAD-binding protein n=1 Tax=Streptomyces mirabilis TaxID=68239 RepID=UPI003F4B0AAF